MDNPSKKETLKIILAVIGSALLTIFLTLAFFPSFLSTSIGNTFATKLVNSQIPGKVQFKSLNTSWFGSQHIEGLILYDSNGASIADVNEITATSGLLKLLTKPGKSGNFEIKGLNAHIIQYADGSSNLQEAILGKKASGGETDRSPVSIYLSGIDLLTSSGENGEKFIDLTGSTKEQNLEGKFTVQAKIFKNVKNTQDLFENSEFSASANNFPVRLLDEILALSDVRFKGLLSSALGDKMQFSVNQTKSENGIGLALELKSPLLNGTSRATLKNDRLSINEQDSFEWNISPEFVSILNALNTNEFKVALKNATRGLVKVSDTNIVYKNSKIDLVNSFATFSLSVDQADFVTSDPIGDVSLKGLNFTAKADDNKDVIEISLTADTEIAGALSKLDAKATLSRALEIDDMSTLNGSKISLNLEGLSLDTINHIYKLPYELKELIGKNLNLTADFKLDKTSTIAISVDSENIKTDPMMFSIDTDLKLINPSNIRAIISPYLIKSVTNNSSLSLQNNVPVDILISKLLLPKYSNIKKNFYETLNDIDLSLHLKFGRLDIQGLLENSKLSLNDAVLDLNAQASKPKNLVFNTSIFSDDFKFQKLVGNGANLDLASSFDVKPKNIDVNNIKALIDSPYLKTEIQGKLEDLTKFFITKPITFSYQLNPDAVLALGLDDFKLEDDANLAVHIESSSKPIDLDNILLTNLKGSVQVDKIDLYGNAGSIKNLKLPWNIDGYNNQINLKVQGLTNLNLGKNEGSIIGQIDISNWLTNKSVNFDKASVNTNLNLINFPVSFIEKISQINDLRNLVGSSINVNISGDLSNNSQTSGLFNIHFHGDGFEGTGNFEYVEGVKITNTSSPVTVKYVLTPERFQALRKRMQTKGTKPNYVVITSPSNIQFNLKTFSIPLINKEINLLKSEIDSEFSLDNLEIENFESKDHVTLTNISGYLESPQIAKDLKFTLNGEHFEKNSTPLPFNLNGTVKNLFNVANVIDIDNLSISLNGLLQQFPVRLLGQFANLDDALSKRISAVIGDKINARLRVHIDQMQGPVAIDVSGANGNFSLDSYVRDGILTLNKNFTTEVKMTETLGREVLSEIFPLASGLIGADNPLTINVDADGFSLPIKNFNFNQLSVRNASLSLGKVYFYNSGQLGSILSLFNNGRSDNIAVWFTPLYINMQSGVININRIDMLIMDQYPIATWGNVDFIQNHVNMMIGLTGQALKNGFNLNGLGKNYIVQIPFTGPINSPSIDKKKATAKIAAIVAANRGPEGLLIGTALNIASGGLKESRPPEPTTKPLPWSTGDGEVDNSYQEAQGSVDTDKKKKKKKPIHNIEETAGKIIQNLIPF